VEKGMIKETSREEILRFIEAAANQPEILFTGGGEPSMLKELPFFISYAKQVGIKRVGMETNGMLFAYESYTKKLKESGLDFCIISLHSHHPDIADMIVQKQGSFTHTINGMRNMEKEGIQISSILHTITTYNYKELKEFILFIREHFPRISHFGFGLMRPINENPASRNFTPRLSQLQPFLFEALAYCKEHGITVDISPRMNIPFCFLGEFIRSSGELRAFKEKTEEEFKKLTSMAEKVKGRQCSQCAMNVMCSGIFKEYSDLYGTSELVPLEKVYGL
jgi:MoaA/NifB/PqqE/SkfB family radical SAM enzyme